MSPCARSSSRTTVAAIGDRTKEGNETFQVRLSNPVNATIANGTGTITIVDDDGALTAAAAPSVTSSVAPLTQSTLDRVVSAAEAAWLDADPDAGFAGVTVSVGELPMLQLGLTEGLAITIDATAAGWGWSVSSQDGRMDLYTVVLHELGHALGLDHQDEGLMGDVLAAGESHDPTAAPTAHATVNEHTLLPGASVAISAALPGPVATVRRATIAPGSSLQKLRPQRAPRLASRHRIRSGL